MWGTVFLGILLSTATESDRFQNFPRRLRISPKSQKRTIRIPKCPLDDEGENGLDDDDDAAIGPPRDEGEKNDCDRDRLRLDVLVADDDDDDVDGDDDGDDTGDVKPAVGAPMGGAGGTPDGRRH